MCSNARASQWIRWSTVFGLAMGYPSIPMATAQDNPKKLGKARGKAMLQSLMLSKAAPSLMRMPSFMEDLISLHQSLGRGFPSEMTGMLTMSTPGHRNSSTVLIRQNMLCISLNVVLKL
jgi:hypothetical protein